jgi:hypothetical protein
MTASRPRNAAPYPVIWPTPRGGHQCSDAPDLFDMAAQLCAVDARTDNGGYLRTGWPPVRVTKRDRLQAQRNARSPTMYCLLMVR